MSDSQGVLLFTNGSSAGGSSSDYDKDAFQDISLPATNNSGLTSTVSTNPLAEYFANDGAPKWMAKTLFIKDLQRVEDRTLWVNGRATYKIIWHEDFPGAVGYCYGSVSLGGTGESRFVSINDNGDGCGVSGVIRRVMWLIRPQTGTATGTPALDGSNLSTINYGGYTGLGNNFTTRKPIFEAYTTDTSNATHNIHDHRVVANEVNKLQVIGCVVYYNLSGDGIEAFPGDTYVDKSKTSMAGASLSYPLGYSNFLGGWDGLYTTSNGVFGATSSPILAAAANCSGATNTNLLNVSIGSGSSFPIGTGLYIPDGGSSYYLGAVTNVSGDVLTISPTLAIGLSNICSALFNAGPSFAISATYYAQSYSYQPSVNYAPYGASLLPIENPFSFSDPYLRYRVWGTSLQLVTGQSAFTGLGNTLGINFPTTNDFLNFEGRFSGLEFEFMVGTSALLSATYIIDGIVSTGQSTVLDGPTVLRQTVMANGGMGWHSVRMLNAGSTNVYLSRITAYEPKIWNGPSFGLLAQVSVGQTFTLRNAQNASLMAFGNITRIYAESLRANGASWGSTAEAGPGGRSISTTNDGDYMEFQYFGTQFALLGAAGTSTLMTIDGSSIGPNFNGWNNSSATLGFHTVRVTSKTGTLKLFGYDYLNPVGSVRNKQLFDPVANLSRMPRVFVQTSEPTNARTGDVWQVDVQNKISYIRLFGGWQKMALSPNVTIQTFTSGTAQTYILPAAVKYLKVKVLAGGAGGAGSGTSDGTAATDGGNSTFGTGLLTANGGTHGVRNQVGGAGGTGTVVAPAIGFVVAGGAGGSAGFLSGSADTGATPQGGGGHGGSSGLGFGASGGAAGGTGAGQAAAANSGAGGGGGYAGATNNAAAGAGGGGGAYVEAYIFNPEPTYTYTVGAKGNGGAAGGSGFAGGDGAAGKIIVEEYYF